MSGSRARALQPSLCARPYALATERLSNWSSIKYFRSMLISSSIASVSIAGVGSSATFSTLQIGPESSEASSSASVRPTLSLSPRALPTASRTRSRHPQN
jgi:hypothetical protein